MKRASRYLMENPQEPQRLEEKTDLRAVRERLELVGLRPGMKVLDAGSGTGAVARVMAKVVGDGGEVVALDFSKERARFGARRAHGNPRLQFLVADLDHPALRPGAFDFVWSEFVFEYLEAPDAAVEKMAQLLRPGGKLVVADLDGNGFFHYPIQAELEAAMKRLESTLKGSFDPFAGRKLYHRFRRAGLESIRVHVLPYHLYAGAAPDEALAHWELKLNTIRERGIQAVGGSAKEYDRFARAFLDLLRDPDTMSYSVLFLVEGLKARPALS